jgi:hypothetical protein
MEERRCDFIAAIFAKCDVDNVCKSEAIEHRADGVSNIEHQHSQAAVHFVWTRAASVRCLANASNWRQRPVDQSNNSAKLYSLHGPRKRVTPKLSASALHVTGALELGKNLLEKFDWQFLLCGELGYLQHRPAKLRGDAKIDEGSERVLATFRKFHVVLLRGDVAGSVTSILRRTCR